jgi:hypothetical protein
MSEYRKTEGDNPLLPYNEQQLRNREDLLKIIRERGGVSSSGVETLPLYEVAFPTGFDPDNNPEDNLEKVRAEITRRG